MFTGGFIEGMLAFAAYVAVVLAATRLARAMEPALIAVAAAFAVCAAALTACVLLGRSFNFWIFLVSYWFLATSFLMAFGAVYKSLSLRILADLLDKPQRSGDYHEIFSRYLVQDSYQNRLAVIRDKELVALRDDRYELTPRGRVLAQRVRSVQLRFGIARSG
jgi:hypothetical protein